ncbi:MAG: large conductance mechanosensitive channel protein MscL [Gemmatimonadetes bacterium]|nr:large conductance mechanosensitive channel protein MscL [Gemmatimonadota bacterium]
MLKEFKEFVVRGSVVDLAVGFIVGAAFTALVKSLVSNLAMPPLGLLVGDIEFQDQFWLLRSGDPAGPYATLADAQAAGATTMNYGLFVDELVAFLLVAWAVFLVVRAVNRMERRRQGDVLPGEPTTKSCPYCVSEIPVGAVRCAFCTSEVGEAAR